MFAPQQYIVLRLIEGEGSAPIPPDLMSYDNGDIMGFDNGDLMQYS